MNLAEMKNHEWLVSWSGGKDSTATIILMHEKKIPIKKIVYVKMMYDDTIPATLPLMNDFIDTAINQFKKWGYKVEILQSYQTAYDLATKKYSRSLKKEKNGKFYGITAFCRGYCSFTGIKTKTINLFKNDNDFEMIGYAIDEKNRIHRLNDRKQSILVNLQITEKECLEICRKYNLLSPLYELGINRDGCFFCPNANNLQRELIKKEYPNLYNQIKKLYKMCDYDITYLQKRNNWLRDVIIDVSRDE